MRKPGITATWAGLVTTILGSLAGAEPVRAAEFVVYSVYRGLDLGNPGETPLKDYFVNMGTAQGVRAGMRLEVIRRVSTYDLASQKLYKDVSFPFATLKVIHVENNAAIARLDKLTPAEQTPSMSVRAVMVGDLVRPAE